jgi:uncharacterized protein YsxB (DUF464 family)
MIEIAAIVSPQGLLRSCKASGHAGWGKAGRDIVCAAVSVLMRTGLEALQSRSGIKVEGYAEKGECWIEVSCDSDEGDKSRDFLMGVGTFLLKGLQSVADEYPRYCRMNILEEF